MAAFVAGAAGLGLVVAYLGLIAGQGGPFDSRTVLVAGWLAVSAALSLAGAFSVTPGRRALLSGMATSMLAVLGYTALMSMGAVIMLLALIAGGAASVAAYQAGVGPLRRLGFFVLLIFLASGAMALGLNLTDL